MKNVKLLALFLSLLLSSTANAHVVQGGGFINGFVHPIFGTDHLLAMLSVGLLSKQIGGRAIWLAPTAFVVVMLLGGILGMMGMLLPAAEMGIALSVLILGIAMALDKKMPVFWPTLSIGFFALFHGYAHGQEMPSLAHPALYVSGFIIATILLHFAGVAIGIISQRFKNGKSFLRYLGAGVTGIGFSILTGI